MSAVTANLYVTSHAENRLIREMLTRVKIGAVVNNILVVRPPSGTVDWKCSIPDEHHQANSRLLRPMAIGRIRLATQLLSAVRSPSSM